MAGTAITDTTILMRYAGGDADQHAVDMRLLGQSLQGFDRIISDGVILFLKKRAPKRGERAPVISKAREPRQGSSEIAAFLAAAPGVLPLVWNILTNGTSNFVWHWVSFVLKYLGGRKAEAEKHLEMVLEIIKEQGGERERTRDAWLAHDAVWRDRIFDQMNKLVGPAIQAVAPVGKSVRSASFSAGSAPQTTVDEAMADAIRSKGELEVGDLQQMTLQTDGFVHHSRRLNVEHPDEPGNYLYADVKDPLADVAPNPYSEAANRKAAIVVQAKPAYREGRMERIYIMDFEREL